MSLAVRGAPASYAVVTTVFTLLVTALVVGWRDSDRPARDSVSRGTVAAAAIIAAGAILIAAWRWTRLLAWLPYHADMLIVIREATRRFLNGQMPYATYHSYDTSWDMAMPYGPALWGPFVIPQLLRLDFRIITIIGELFVPIWCGVATVIEASRGRTVAAVSWFALLAALLFALDIQRFTLLAHTPVYWPLLLPLAVTMPKGRWTAAAVLLGLLVVARQTMVSMIPVFVIAVWMADRRSAIKATAALALTIGLAILPFVAWDARAIWESMVLSYPRVMKNAVWPVLARPGLETIGVTEWLIERHRESLVTPVQLAALAITYGAAWFPLRNGRNALPWMTLALFAFSMTTLYPVHYLYYDVLLLLACGRLAETLDITPADVTPIAWTLSVAAAAIVVFAAVRIVASPLPSVAAGQASDDRPMRDGFAASESDGARDFAWIVGNQARVILPRSSASAADLVIVAQSPFGENQPPQRMAAILNGTLLSETTVPSGWQEIRIAAPRPAWWIGYNDLQLRFSSTLSPGAAGLGADPRPLALGLSRVDVVKKKE